MATINADVKRIQLTNEADAAATLITKQLAYALDSKRLVYKQADATLRYFWDSTALAATTDSAAGADRIGVTGITGVTPQGGSSGGNGTVQSMMEGFKTYTDGAYVTLATTQTISGAKTFSAATVMAAVTATTLTTSGAVALNGTTLTLNSTSFPQYRIPYITNTSGNVGVTSNLQYNFSTSTLSSANGSFSGTLAVTGATTLSSTLSTAGLYTAAGGVLVRGATTQPAALRVDANVTGSGGATALALADIGVTGIQSVTTQDNSITYSRIATLSLGEPKITKGATDAITTAATLYILEAPTEGANNYSLFVDAGATRLDGVVEMQSTASITGNLTNTVLAGTGTRLVTATSAGLLGNATTIAGNYTFSDAIIAASTLSVTGGNLDVTRSAAGITHTLLVSNTNNANTSSHARLRAIVGGSSAGDPFVNFVVSGVTEFSMGIDNSDSDKFKISRSADLGTSDAISIDSARRVTIPFMQMPTSVPASPQANDMYWEDPGGATNGTLFIYDGAEWHYWNATGRV